MSSCETVDDVKSTESSNWLRKDQVPNPIHILDTRSKIAAPILANMAIRGTAISLKPIGTTGCSSASGRSDIQEPLTTSLQRRSRMNIRTVLFNYRTNLGLIGLDDGTPTTQQYPIQHLVRGASVAASASPKRHLGRLIPILRLQEQGRMRP